MLLIYPLEKVVSQQEMAIQMSQNLMKRILLILTLVLKFLMEKMSRICSNF